MAVEFRSRVWFSAEKLPVTLDWLKQHNIGEYTSSETQGFKGDGKGREKLGARKKERGGEGKGKRKGEALGSFSIQIISRSKSKHH